MKRNRQFPLESKQRQKSSSEPSLHDQLALACCFFVAICAEMPSSKSIRLCPEYYRSTKKKDHPCCIKTLGEGEFFAPDYSLCLLSQRLNERNILVFYIHLRSLS